MKKRDGDAMSGGVLCMRCCSFSSCRGEWHVARCMYGVCMESPFRARSMHTIYHSMPMHDVNDVSICQSIRISVPHLFHICSTSLHPRYNGAPVRCHAAPRGHAPRPPPTRARPAAGRPPRRGPPPRAVPHVPHVLRQGVPRRRVPRHPPPRRPCTSA